MYGVASTMLTHTTFFTFIISSQTFGLDGLLSLITISKNTYIAKQIPHTSDNIPIYVVTF